jgi:hypothetical protein
MTAVKEGKAMRSKIRGILSVVMSSLLVGGPLVGLARAVDGTKLISQNNALAGNVTPGDAPGFPVTISVRGSYVLSSNLTVPDENTTAIEIVADDVTLDLNGFTVQGPTVCDAPPPTFQFACAQTGTGIGIDAHTRNQTTVANGVVRGMGGIGMTVGNNARVERVHTASNGSIGITTGENSTVTGNTVRFNGGGGISTSLSCTVSGNSAMVNGGAGISVEFGSTVSGNSAVANSGHGIVAGQGSIVSGNSAAGNGGAGLNLSVHSGYTQNVMSVNGSGTVVGFGVSLGQNLCDGVVC